jgi:fatty acid synthase
MLQLSEECYSLPDHGARVQWTVDQLVATGIVTDRKDLAAAVESFWCKLKMADEYKPAKKLKLSKVTLFQATERLGGLGEAHGLGADYGLGEVCTGEVKVHQVQGDHDTFIQGASAEAIATVINDLM